MKFELLDLRRFFRNRFECYIDRGDASGAGVFDGVPLTLRDLCNILVNDDEPFPRHYDRDVRTLCGHEYLIWFRMERSYGDVARLMNCLLDSRDAGVMRPGGLWVSDVLRSRSVERTQRPADHTAIERQRGLSNAE